MSVRVERRLGSWDLDDRIGVGIVRVGREPLFP